MTRHMCLWPNRIKDNPPYGGFFVCVPPVAGIVFTGLLRFTRNDRGAGISSPLSFWGVRPQNLGIDVMRACARHNPLDCFVSLAMTKGMNSWEINHPCHCEQAQRAWQSRKHTNKFKFLETSRGMRYTFLALGNRCRLKNLVTLSAMTLNYLQLNRLGGCEYIE